MLDLLGGTIYPLDPYLSSRNTFRPSLQYTLVIRKDHLDPASELCKHHACPDFKYRRVRGVVQCVENSGYREVHVQETDFGSDSANGCVKLSDLLDVLACQKWHISPVPSGGIEEGPNDEQKVLTLLTPSPRTFNTLTADPNTSFKPLITSSPSFSFLNSTLPSSSLPCTACAVCVRGTVNTTSRS